MDLDLDLFDRDQRHHRGRRDRDRRRDDDDDDDREHRGGWERSAARARDRHDDDDDHRPAPRRSSRHRSYDDRDHDRGWHGFRRAHRHGFAWLVLGGGALLMVAAVLAIISAVGGWGAISDGYFALTTALMPASWHDEWRALPGFAHVGIVLGAVFVGGGLFGEIFD